MDSTAPYRGLQRPLTDTNSCSHSRKLTRSHRESRSIRGATRFHWVLGVDTPRQPWYGRFIGEGGAEQASLRPGVYLDNRIAMIVTRRN